jgi:TolB protein
MRTKQRWLRAALVAATVMVATGQATPAEAGTFPGRNGRIAFVSNGNIYTIRADGTDRRVVKYTSATELSPSWSPDGRQIAFVRLVGSNFEIYRMNADGSGERRLTSHSAIDKQPTWSRDGKRIAFASSRTGRYQVFTMRATDGGDLRNVYPRSYNVYSPSYSPTSSRLVFAIAFNGQADLYGAYDPVSCSAPCGFVRYTSTADITESDPSWTPDGKAIVHSQSWGDQTSIAKKTVGGSTQSLAWHGSTGLVSNPVCSPDGSLMVYALATSSSTQIRRTECTNYRGRPSPSYLTTGHSPDWQRLPGWSKTYKK